MSRWVHLWLCRIHFNPHESWRSRCGWQSGKQVGWIWGWSAKVFRHLFLHQPTLLICKQGRGMTARQETVVAFCPSASLIFPTDAYLNIRKLVSNLFLLSSKSGVDFEKNIQTLNHKTNKQFRATVVTLQRWAGWKLATWEHKELLAELITLHSGHFQPRVAELITSKLESKLKSSHESNGRVEWEEEEAADAIGARFLGSTQPPALISRKLIFMQYN